MCTTSTGSAYGMVHTHIKTIPFDEMQDFEQKIVCDYFEIEDQRFKFSLKLFATETSRVLKRELFLCSLDQKKSDINYIVT